MQRIAAVRKARVKDELNLPSTLPVGYSHVGIDSNSGARAGGSLILLARSKIS